MSDITILHSLYSPSSRALVASLGVEVPAGDDVTVAVGVDTVRIVSDHAKAVGICSAFPGYPTAVVTVDDVQYTLPSPATWAEVTAWAADPVPTAPAVTTLSFEVFMRRFTDTELELATALAKDDVKVDIFWKRVMAAAATGIDLTYQPVIVGVNYLVGKVAGFDQARANAVLGITA